MWSLFYVSMYWFQTKAAVMKMMKHVNWIFMKCSFPELHIPFIIFLSLCQTYTHSGPICLTYLVTASAINLVRVAVAIPFTLIKTTNAPTALPICSHSIAFSSDNWTFCLIDWCDLILWTILFSPHSLLLLSHLREVCRRDRGHRLWRADLHRVPQRCYKEVR